MSTATFQKPNLRSPRDNSLLMHVCRNTISTLEVMHSHFFSGVSMDACRKAAKRLCDEGYLTKYPLWDNKSLYRIGQKCVSRFGFPRKRSKKLGSVRLPYEVGCLAFTCMNTEQHWRLLPFEIPRACNGFPMSLAHYWAYTWRDKCLSTVRVELRCGNPTRVIQKLSEQLYQYRQHGPLEQLYVEGRFRFVVVVGSESQEAVLHQANDDLGSPIAMKTSYYAELVRFM